MACQQSSRYQPIPSKGSGRHVRDTTIQHDLCFISVFYSTSLVPQHAFFLLMYFLPNIATHNNTTHNSFIQSISGLVSTVQLTPVGRCDSYTPCIQHLKKIHRCLFTSGCQSLDSLTAVCCDRKKIISMICLNVQPSLQ